jgi:hypothetical protein
LLGLWESGERSIPLVVNNRHIFKQSGELEFQRLRTGHAHSQAPNLYLGILQFVRPISEKLIYESGHIVTSRVKIHEREHATILVGTEAEDISGIG